MSTLRYDVVIVGGGIVGLSIAKQLIEKDCKTMVLIVEKEYCSGRHASGRNSGVLHAGLYYKPNSLKARVCIKGATQLKQWAEQKDIKINECGKIIIPQREELDSQLEILLERGKKNGASVELLKLDDVRHLAPLIRSASGRAIWSPNTCIINPRDVMHTLQNDLAKEGVKFKFNASYCEIDKVNMSLKFSDSSVVEYGHLYNCAGANADVIAHKFKLGLNYKIIPFRGSYWRIRSNEDFKIRTNIYPVPDLNFPFLGLHLTPSSTNSNEIYLGPTATLAFGRENYLINQSLEPLATASNIISLAHDVITNNGNLRAYAIEQALQGVRPFLLKAARQLLPDLKQDDILQSSKVGIRPQLYDKVNNCLVEDFLCINGQHSTHVLNSISPAFTASFALADLIIEQSGFL